MHIIILILLLTGCSGPRYADFFPYHDDGQAKPKVEFLPVKGEESLARDIQEMISEDAMDSGKLFFVPQGGSADFVVQVELLENQIAPCGGLKRFVHSRFQHQEIVKLRLKVTDIRCQPKIILYEVIERSWVIPGDNDPRWTIDKVYEQIANDAILRIEEVILWNK